VLSPRTERDYRQVVERWTREGQPDPATWVSERSSEATRRNVRAALIWHHRVNLGRTLNIPWVGPTQRPVPSAFSVEELAIIREASLDVHRRCRPVIDLLYSTGARLQEACAITLEDVTDTHVILRDTKRRPRGLQVHRAVPLGPVSRAAVIELRQLPPGKRNTLIVACQHRVQDWMRELQRRTGMANSGRTSARSDLLPLLFFIVSLVCQVTLRRQSPGRPCRLVSVHVSRGASQRA
jgi:integrase